MENPVTWGSLFRVFGRIGILSFGGPAAQIALMHSELVDRQRWLTDDTFLRALSLCMLLPGPEAMQLATYAGWRLRGTMGGLLAGLLFILPGAFVILALALIYTAYGTVPLVQAAFLGIKTCVLVIVFQALLRLSRKTLTTPLAWSLAVAAFFALFLFNTPFPVVIAVAALLGAATARSDIPSPPPPVQHAQNPFKVVVIWGALWFTPIALVAAYDHAFLLQVALFFSKLAIVTFGGAYAVLAYMTQTVVTEYDWISTAQMIDALGLAETTPGPLILVTQFVALIAGFAQGGLPLALAAGATALWVTFIPCFLWIFLAGPYVEHIAQKPRLAAALRAITAAVVGVILNLALWFAIHVLFAQTHNVPPVASPLPVWASLDATALLLASLAAVLLLFARRGVAETLGLMAVAGVASTMLGLH